MIPWIPAEIPAIPMIRVLRQYCDHHGIQLRLNRPEELRRALIHYCLNAKYYN